MALRWWMTILDSFYCPSLHKAPLNDLTVLADLCWSKSPLHGQTTDQLYCIHFLWAANWRSLNDLKEQRIIYKNNCIMQTWIKKLVLFVSPFHSRADSKMWFTIKAPKSSKHQQTFICSQQWTPFCCSFFFNTIEVNLRHQGSFVKKNA